MKNLLKTNRIYIFLFIFILSNSISVYSQGADPRTTIIKTFDKYIKYSDLARIDPQSFYTSDIISEDSSNNMYTISIYYNNVTNLDPIGTTQPPDCLYSINRTPGNIFSPTYKRTGSISDFFQSASGTIYSDNLLYFKTEITRRLRNDVGGNIFTNLSDRTFKLVVVVEIYGISPRMQDIRVLKLPAIPQFSPGSSQKGTIVVKRGGAETQRIDLDSEKSLEADLIVYQGDEVNFETSSDENPKVSGLTSTDVFRWAGEVLFFQSEIQYDNNETVIPFLAFDSNVHGVKMRKFPASMNGSLKKTGFLNVDNIKRLKWIANGRYDNGISASLRSDMDIYQGYRKNLFSNVKWKGVNQSYPNQNKFYGPVSPNIIYQMNNQKEGLNLELLDQFLANKSFVAGLDPDELIYQDWNFSDLVYYRTILERDQKKFRYISDDKWKDPKGLGTSINAGLDRFLDKTLQIYANAPWYDYRGNEIDDVDLYRYQDNVMRIQNKDFDNKLPQDMFNNKRPVYYIDSRFNKPIINNRNLYFAVNQIDQPFKINLIVNSVLEGPRINKGRYDLNDEDRKNPQVNFYGIIDGPIHVSRYQKDVEYKVSEDIVKNSGSFKLVYTYEDPNGIISEDVQDIDNENKKVLFNIRGIKGGGYHDVTLRYSPVKGELKDYVIIAGKELIDMDLRFIFSPDQTQGKDFSYNPQTTFGTTEYTKLAKGKVTLGENKGNGKNWFLSDVNKTLEANDYGTNYGYKDHSVVKTYTLGIDETITLTVMDADPHSLVHYTPDFYLSERRLSKRLLDDELSDAKGHSKIEWFSSVSRDFTYPKLEAVGRYCTFKPRSSSYGLKPLYLKAVFNGHSEVVVKMVIRNITEGKITCVGLNAGASLGLVEGRTLSDDQYNFIKTLLPSLATSKGNLRLYKIQDLLSSYTYGQKSDWDAKWYSAFRYIALGGSNKEVGEHKRFADDANYDARFVWEFRKNKLNESKYILPNKDFTYDFTDVGVKSIYVDRYLSKWFPRSWIRHLDSPPASPELPQTRTDALVSSYNDYNDESFSKYPSANKYEPWQIRLPWISQAGLNGYKTRWNIKCIYDLKKIFDVTKVGTAYGLTSDRTAYDAAILGDNGSQILPGFDDKQREYQELYQMLVNGELLLVNKLELDKKSSTVYIAVRDKAQTLVYNNTLPTTTSSSKLSGGTKEVSLTDDENSSFCKVYPNPSSQGIFKLDINIPQENAQLELQLTDIAGKNIYTSPVKTVSGSYSTTVGEKLNLLKGVYLLTIKINDDTETQKLIVE